MVGAQSRSLLCALESHHEGNIPVQFMGRDYKIMESKCATVHTDDPNRIMYIQRTIQPTPPRYIERSNERFKSTGLRSQNTV